MLLIYGESFIVEIWIFVLETHGLFVCSFVSEGNWRHYILFNIVSYIKLHCSSQFFLRVKVSFTLKSFRSQIMKALTYNSWLDGNIEGKQGWVSRAKFYYNRGQTFPRFHMFPWFAAMKPVFQMLKVEICIQKRNIVFLQYSRIYMKNKKNNRIITNTFSEQFLYMFCFQENSIWHFMQIVSG